MFGPPTMPSAMPVTVHSPLPVTARSAMPSTVPVFASRRDLLPAPRGPAGAPTGGAGGFTCRMRDRCGPVRASEASGYARRAARHVRGQFGASRQDALGSDPHRTGVARQGVSHCSPDRPEDPSPASSGAGQALEAVLLTSATVHASAGAPASRPPRDQEGPASRVIATEPAKAIDAKTSEATAVATTDAAVTWPLEPRTVRPPWWLLVAAKT